MEGVKGNEMMGIEGDMKGWSDDGKREGVKTNASPTPLGRGGNAWTLPRKAPKDTKCIFNANKARALQAPRIDVDF